MRRLIGESIGRGGLLTSGDLEALLQFLLSGITPAIFQNIIWNLDSFANFLIFSDDSGVWEGIEMIFTATKVCRIL